MNSVAILLSTYNGEKYLRELLDSVLNQKEVNLSLLVRDDGSCDKTIEILKEYEEKYPNFHLSYGEGNLGYAKSFSTLIRNAPSFDYYACCDQDDVWLPNKLIDAITEIQKVETANMPVLFHSSCIVTDENLKEITKNSHPHYSRQTDTRFEESLLLSNINGCTTVFNRPLKKLYSKIPVDRIYAGHDYTLSTIASALGKVIFSDNSNIYYRQHKHNSFGYYKYSLLRSLKNFFKHETKSLRTHEAQMIKDFFYDDLSKHNKNFLDLVINYKQSAKDKRALKRYIKQNIKNKIVCTYSNLLINLGKL